MTDSSSQQTPGVLANILAVAGFIILIVIIVWGAYHLLRLTGSGVSNLFSRFSNGSSINVTLPKDSVQSGATFPVSWKYTPTESGSYAFLYQCKTGLRLEMKDAAGKAQTIPCGTAYTVGTTTALSLMATSAGTSSLEVPVSVVFIPAATSTTARPQGTGTFRVAAKSADTVTTPAVTSPTKPATAGTSAAARPAQPVGKPDLAVRVLAIGVINPVSGAFENRYPTGPNDIAAVKFDIANNGGSSSGNYYFTVSLPIAGGYVYSSPIQSSLTPGSRVESILRFKPVQSGGGMVTVAIDTTYAVSESNEGNNSGGMFISAPAWTGSYAPYVY